MAIYMIQVAYTPEAWASLLKNPQNRAEVVGQTIQKLGGTIQGSWLAFGEHDIILVAQMPDNVSAAAFSMAVAAGGAVKSCTTTPLMTLEEGLQAMKKAAGSGYRPPTG